MTEIEIIIGVLGVVGFVFVLIVLEGMTRPWRGIYKD